MTTAFLLVFKRKKIHATYLIFIIHIKPVEIKKILEGGGGWAFVKKCWPTRLDREIKIA